MRLYKKYRIALRPIFWLLLVLAAIQIVVWLAPPLYAAKGIANYAPLHTLLELIAIVIAVLVFAVGWGAYDKERPSNFMLLACTFGGVAILDLLHALSYQGMPDFITPSSPEKAIDFWLTARALGALGLLTIAFLPWRQTCSAAARWLMLAGVLLLVAIVGWIGLLHPAWTPPTYSLGRGLTAFKVNSEYVLCAINIITAIRFLQQMRVPQPYNVAGLFAAVSVMALSELFFTLYADVTDVFNLLGHIYKVIAYCFIYNSIFIDSIRAPYQRMYESKNLLQTVIEAVPVRIFWKDRELRYLGCNTLFASDAGKDSPENVIGKDDEQMAWCEQAELYRSDDRKVMQSASPKLGYEEPQTLSSGERIWLRTSKVPLHDAANDVIGVLGIYEDITARKQAEQAQIELGRALKLLSQCNSLLVHAENEQGILSDVCKLAVETGGYLMAWVGFAENDTTKTVRPVARAGYGQGYLDDANITWSDKERGQGPSGTAIRTRETVISQNILTNPKMAPWREAGIKIGFQSCISLPLVGDKHVLGVLTIYSTESDAFSKEEVLLLEELANDLAYGIETLRTRVKHEVAEKKIEFLAYHDPLTGLPNRLLLRDRFDQAAALANRERSGVAVIFLDLDNFKHVNDSLGHVVGDQLLIRVAERLQLCIRDIDTISRQGGDEFIIFLTNLHDAVTTQAIAQKIIDAFGEPFDIDHQTLTMSFSIGISLFPDDGPDFDTLLKQADTALYEAKDAGKNAYRFFSAQMNSDVMENLQLQSQLHKAVKNQEFVLHYQTQIDVLSGRIIGAEALVRWQHSELGLVYPARFIALAERSGLISQIGEWVLNEACRQAQTWRETYGLPPIVMAVNLSSLQFKRGNLVETVINALAQSGLPAAQLELELTESILLQDIEVVMKTLRRLKEIGVKLSIDDFGTGYSSLTYLKRLAVDKLKIDQSFVRDMVENSDDAAIVEAIIQLGHILKLTVIAEGVENDTQLAILKNYGCDEIQGYLFSRPIPAKEFADFCKQRMSAMV